MQNVLSFPLLGRAVMRHTVRDTGAYKAKGEVESEVKRERQREEERGEGQNV